MLGVLPDPPPLVLPCLLDDLPRQSVVRPEAGASVLGQQACAEPLQNTEVCFLSNSRKQAWLLAHL